MTDGTKGAASRIQASPVAPLSDAKSPARAGLSLERNRLRAERLPHAACRIDYS